MLSFTPPGFGVLPSLPNSAAVAANVHQSTGQPQIICSSDGKFVWVPTTGSVAGHWERIRAGQTCTSYQPEGTTPDVRDQRGDAGGGGGITVSTVDSYRTLHNRQQQLLVTRSQRETQQLVALAPFLPPCPASSLSTQGCYGNTPAPSLGTMLLPPGSFEYYGVPFHTAEIDVTTGRFQKTFTPDAEQRFLFDFAIVDASANVMTTYPEYGKVINVISIENALTRWPDFKLSLDNFSLNPIAPTQAEMTGTGGLVTWMKRGGYPLSLGVATAAVPIVVGRGIPLCASIKCGCPQTMTAEWKTASGIPVDQAVTSWPRCIGSTLQPKDNQSWDVYVSLNAASVGQITLAFIAQKAWWGEKMATWFGDRLTSLANLFCANPAPIKQELTNTVAEKCIDKAHKPCKKGSPGCTCVQAPASAQVGVNLFNGWASHWCNGWTGENTPPIYEPPTPQAPANWEQKTGTPWWVWGLVIGAGVGAVAIWRTR